MKKLFVFICALAAGGVVIAQTLDRQVVSSGGAYATAGNVSLSYTIGEVAVATLTGGNLILTQGFQQPDGAPVGISEPPFTGSIKVYPNPTDDIIMVEITTDQSDLVLELSNALGQQLLSQELPLDGGTYSGQVDMQTYAAGNYLLYLRDSNGRIVTSYNVQKVK